MNDPTPSTDHECVLAPIPSMKLYDVLELSPSPETSDWLFARFLQNNKSRSLIGKGAARTEPKYQRAVHSLPSPPEVLGLLIQIRLVDFMDDD